MRQSFGLVMMALGAMLVLAGALAWAGALSWFGRLPGDIRIERPGFRIYVPLVSMLLVSLALSALLTLFRRMKP